MRNRFIIMSVSLVLRSIGVLITLAMAIAAALAAYHTNLFWTLTWGIGALLFGAFSLIRNKKAEA